MSITVVLADDHALLRQMLAYRLNLEPDIEVVGEVSTAEEAVQAVLRFHPRVVVMDIDMPGQSCFYAAEQILSSSPETQILFLSAFFHDRYIEQALEVQALGYVTKGEPPENVVLAVRAAAQGEAYFSPEVMERIVVDARGAHLRRRADSAKALISLLTVRELEILRQISRGLAKKEIAELLHVTVKTVENHTHSLMTKLSIHDRVHLARFAIREGLAEA
jgi:DNA-binding NarL/FixJ family response regulator